MVVASQRWNAEDYLANAGFVPALGAAVVERLAPSAGEQILDLGCGDGTLTLKIAERGARVLGVDGSAEMISAARARGLDALVMDARALDFDARFDAVFSNAALHWMKPAAPVAAGVYRALKPGGRYVGEFGGFGNVAAITVACRAALHIEGIGVSNDSPWYFPTLAEYRSLLEAAGFVDIDAALFARPTPLPTGMRGWLETFGMAHFPDSSESQRKRQIELVCDLLAPVLRSESGEWIADYVRLRFSARKPE